MNKLIQYAVMVAVGVLLFASLLIPMTNEAVATTNTFENDGYFYMQKITAEDTNTYTLTYEYDPDATNHYSYTYNGEAINTDVWPAQPINVTLATNGDTWLLRAGLNEYIGLQGFGGNINGGGHNSWKTVATFSSGTITVTYTNAQGTEGTPKTDSYTDLWIYSPTPTDYVMKKADKAAYMLDDSEYLAMGVTSMSAWNTVIQITGTVEDFTASIVYPPNLTTTITNPVVIADDLSAYVDLYALDKLTFTINDGTTTVDATYSYFIIPAEVTAEKAVHADDSTRAIIGVIPVIVIVGLIAGIIGVVAVRRGA